MNISEQQLNNMMSAVTTALQPLIRALPVTPVEWADQNYYLPKESSYGEGEPPRESWRLNFLRKR